MNIATRMPSAGAGKPSALAPDAGSVMRSLPFGGIGGTLAYQAGVLVNPSLNVARADVHGRPGRDYRAALEAHSRRPTCTISPGASQSADRTGFVYPSFDRCLAVQLARELSCNHRRDPT